jgi:hypothetical protein
LAQRSSKRGHHGAAAQRPAPSRPAGAPAKASRPPQQTPPAHLPQASRSERRNAAVRAALTPLAPGERPWAVIASSAVAAGLGLANLIAWLAGDTIGGKHPAATGIIVFSAVMLACAVGLWRLWYGAVLGFMALLAIIAVLFTLYLIEASNLLGLVVSLLVVFVSGFLFFKLVRVLSRIQMPRHPGR